MKYYYGKLQNLLLLVVMLLTVHTAVAQTIAVTGVVTDKTDGTTLPGVNVTVKGTTNGTITDFDGNYTIQSQTGDVLLVSFVGYTTQEVVVTNGTHNVVLSIDAKSLEEVVVIGYGVAKKSDATGAVTAIDSDDFNKGAISSPQELLIGKAAGVVVSTPSGQPGGKATIRIRGGSSLRAGNDPLVVIDGVPVLNDDVAGMSNGMSTVNPNDIASMTVLKDASATAIYGSRASNGVILITTKKGTKKLKIGYNSSFSVGVPIKQLSVFSGDEYRALITDQISTNGLSAAAATGLGTSNTDWQNEIYQNSFSHDQSLSFSGTTKALPYRVSLGYTDQNGLLKNSNMNRMTGAVNLSPTLFDGALKVNVNLKGTLTKNDFSNEDAIGAAIQFDPTQAISDGNTEFGGYTTWLNGEGKPIDIATKNPNSLLDYRSNTSSVQRFIGNIKLDYKILDGLHANVNLGFDGSSSDGTDNLDKRAAGSYRNPNTNVKPYEQKGRNELFDFYLNYNKGFGFLDSKLDATVGYSWQHFKRENLNTTHAWEAPVNEHIGITNDYENFLVSFFGRVNYTMKDLVILSATVRTDGSSRFSKENRWGVFPAFAAAWKVNKMSFLKNIEFVNELKLRLGYGITGQQDIGDQYYPYIPTYKESQPGASYQMGDYFVNTQRPNPFDENIKWEETTTTNVGLDFSVWNNRFSGSFEYYYRVTNDLLNEAPVAAGTNYSNLVITNVGSMENKGIELSLNYRAISTPDMSLELGVNFTRNENMITKLTLVDDPEYVGYPTGDIEGGKGNKVQVNNIGYAANTFLLFQQVYGADGMPVEGFYTDKTGNGKTVSKDEANKYFVGSPTADYLIGLSSKFNYKNFDLSFSGRISIGNDVYNNNASNMGLYQNLYSQAGYTANVLTDVSKSRFRTAQYWSDFYLEDASFFRMDNIAMGYQFDKLFTEKLSGRVSFTVQNAFVITKYSGLDPEVDGGIDNNIFPRPRTFILGVNLQF